MFFMKPNKACGIVILKRQHLKRDMPHSNLLLLHKPERAGFLALYYYNSGSNSKGIILKEVFPYLALNRERFSNQFFAIRSG